MELYPEGLSKDQFALLSKSTELTSPVLWDDLLTALESKLAHVTRAREHNPYVNLPLAEALADRIRTLHERRESIPEHAEPWCKAMVHYFLQDTDSVPDYASPIGFEDDVDVLNACVRFAGMPELVLAPEDYDDV